MNTHEFVEKFQENQRKAEKNKRRGKGHPNRSCPIYNIVRINRQEDVYKASGFDRHPLFLPSAFSGPTSKGLALTC